MSKSAGSKRVTLEPFRAYVVSNNQFQNMVKEETLSKLVYKATSLDARIKNFSIHSPDKTLLLYNGSGGYGDQIMTWPVVNILQKRGFKVHVMVEPGNESCWWMQPFVESVQTVPIDLGTWNLFPNHAVFESVCNYDEHPDQLHPVDAMLLKIGIDPDGVPADLKSVAPVFTAAELTKAASIGGSTAVFQLCASTMTRSLDADTSASALSRLATAYPDITWLAVFDRFVNPAYVTLANDLKLPNVRVVEFPSLRDLWAVIGRSRLVVSPDSMCLHAAGTQGIPCIGLWGMTNPKNRVIYYKNHIPICKWSVCSHSPCLYSAKGLPPFCPTHDQQSCGVVAAITPDDILGAAASVL